MCYYKVTIFVYEVNQMENKTEENEVYVILYHLWVTSTK